MNRQANALKDMVERMWPAVVEGDPQEAYRLFNFDLCQSFMENLETWAHESDPEKSNGVYAQDCVYTDSRHE